MLKQFTILLLFAPLFCLGQTEIYPLPSSADIIWNKCIDLHNSGELDSVTTPVTFFKDYFNRIDNAKKFYIHTDTVKYSDKSFAIGQIILDRFLEFERRKIGDWTFYYPSGKIYSKGSFSIGVYTECTVIGPQLIGYSFKTGAWKYWYDNGVLMAEGIYEPSQVELKTNCDTDYIKVSNVTMKWNLFDIAGVKMNNVETMISKINSSH